MTKRRPHVRPFAALVLLLSAGFASFAGAETSPLRTLVTGDDTRGWEAVGRLDIAGEAFCTGTLISPDVVLTAAHCLFDDDGNPQEVETIMFRAGLRDGRAEAYRGVRRAVVHSAYDFKDENTTARVAADIALLELDAPVRNPRVQPLTIGTRPRKGAEIGIVSYARNRSERPSMQEVCQVLARQSGMLVMDCEVDHGASGSPIFVMEGGVPKIVSVVSAMASARGIPVALGTALGDELTEMRASLALNDGRFAHAFFTPPAEPAPEEAPAPAARVMVRSGGAASSAKFVRPGGS